MELSVVIVNYNVRDLLLNAVASLRIAMRGIVGEIIVVDNASSDDAIAALNREYPDVITIPLDVNLGFGGGNNVGIERATGEFILLINPDTIVREDTLRVMLDFMRAHPDAGFAGCKILNRDGSFEPASKRGFPSPWSSFCRVFGLSYLFPQSKLFGGYNLTWIDDDHTSQVDALSGCFMFCRGTLLKQLGGFDTDFFHYGEDLDLCYRATLTGKKNYYHPATSIMHLQGESTRRSSLDAIAMFYQAMEIFARKHFRSRLLLLPIRAGIWLRRGMARVNQRIPNWPFVIVDILATLIGFSIGAQIQFGGLFTLPGYAYPEVLIVPPLLFVLTGMIARSYDESDRIPRNAAFGFLLGFFVLSALTYFFKSYAFSRGVVLVTTGVAATIGVASRFLWLLYQRTFGGDAIRRIAFLTATEPSDEIQAAVRRSFFGKPVSVEGRIALTFGQTDGSAMPLLGSIENVGKIAQSHQLTDIFVLDATVSYGEVLRALANSAGQPTRFHILREGGEWLAADSGTRSGGKGEPDMGAFLSKHTRGRILAGVMLLLWPVVYWARPSAITAGAIAGALFGKRQFVGGGPSRLGIPVFTMAGLCGDERLSEREVAAIEGYYAAHQSLLLDCEIILATFRIRKQQQPRNQPAMGNHPIAEP